MARYIIIYDDPDAIERTIYFNGSLKTLREYLDKICRETPQGCKPPLWAQLTNKRRLRKSGRN